MSGRLTKLHLNGRDLGLLYTYSSVRLGVRMLQQFCPPAQPKLTLGQAGMLLLQGDQDAVNVFIQAGVQHDPQLKEIEGADIDKWLDKAVRKPEHGGEGRKIGDIAKVILTALRDGGFVDLIYEDRSLTDGEAENGTRPIVAVREATAPV